MEHYLSLYQNNPLFKGVPAEELLPLLECLKAKKRVCHKGSVIFAKGETARHLGIVLAGRVNTVYDDILGGRSIIGSMNPGQLFCEAFACTINRSLPVSVVAQVESTVLLIDIDLILHSCAATCKQHQQLNENLIHLLAEKYVSINQKLIHLSGRTTRRKLLSYLSEQMRFSGGRPFAIPFNQQELADYLFIDRSGLSTEWNKLKKEGILLSENGRYLLRITPCAGYDCTD